MEPAPHPCAPLQAQLRATAVCCPPRYSRSLISTRCEEEQWRPVPGYAGWYEASDAGNIRSLARASTAGGLLSAWLTSDGYRDVALSRYGRTRVFTVGSLVLLAFRGRPQPGQRARHRGARDDDRLENLYWGLT